MPPLFLGSASPRRRKILEGLGAVFTVVTADTEEIHDAADPVRTVTVNALAKFEACRARVPAEGGLVTADTLVWFEGRLIGKPVDMEEAAGFLRAFSGRTQIVFTAVALGCPAAGGATVHVAASSVTFRRLDEAAIRAYLERTRPLDRAGAYDIDENGDLLIAGHCGSYTNIMGLPAEPVDDWLRLYRFV